jgi:hypothetical protein
MKTKSNHGIYSRVQEEMIAMIKKFILFLLRIFRRALCCFGRKRSDSNSQHDAHLEVVNVVVNDSPNYKKSNTVNLSLHQIFSCLKLNEKNLADGKRLEFMGR